MSEAISPPAKAAAEAQAARRRTAPVAAPPPARPSRARGLVPVLVVVLPSLVFGAYFAQRLARSPTAPAAVAPLSAPAKSPAPAVSRPLQRTEAVADPVARDAKAGPIAAAPIAVPHPVILNAPIRAAPKRPVDVPTAVSAPAAERSSESPASSPVPMPEPPLPVKEAPPPDRWQLMSAGIARCGSEGFFAGVICEQRVRLQYCEGYWGQVAQCASAVNRDNTR